MTPTRLPKRFQYASKMISKDLQIDHKWLQKGLQIVSEGLRISTGFQRASEWIPKSVQMAPKTIPGLNEIGISECSNKKCFTPQLQIYKIQISFLCFDFRLTRPAKIADPIRFYGAISFSGNFPTQQSSD